MGNPLFKPSEGDRFEILRVGLYLTYSEIQQVSAMELLIRLKVRPEGFPNGSPCPFGQIFAPIKRQIKPDSCKNLTGEASSRTNGHG